jgi:hypothetical protein
MNNTRLKIGLICKQLRSATQKRWRREKVCKGVETGWGDEEREGWRRRITAEETGRGWKDGKNGGVWRPQLRACPLLCQSESSRLWKKVTGL